MSRFSRSLILLESAGLIALDENITGIYSVNDIIDNPKNLKFVEIDDTTGLTALNDVGLVTISATLANDGDLNPFEDAIYYENADDINEKNAGTVNIVVTASDNVDNPTVDVLHDLYHSQDTQDFIDENQGGTKVLYDIEIDKLLDLVKQRGE